MSPMGGRRHKGLGFNRPNKKRRVETEPAPAASVNTIGAEIPAPTPRSEPLGPSTAPAEMEPASQAPSAGLDPRDEVFDRCVAAFRVYRKAKRAWDRSYRTHYGSVTYSMWDEPSIVERCLKRMRKADSQLKEAEAKLTSVKREYALVNAHFQLEKSARKFPEFTKFKDLAAERLAAFRAAPDEPARDFPRLDGVESVVAVSVDHFGLEQSFTLGGLFAQYDF